MLRTVLPPAPRRQPSPFVTVVINPHDRHRFSDHKSLGGQNNMVFKGLPERPKLFIIAVCVGNNLIDQFA
jgi:hypothetical protein